MKEQDYLDIEAYLQGELTLEAAAALEARSESDTAFAAALADRRQLQGHLAATTGEAALRETLRPLNDKYFAEEKGVTVRQLQPSGTYRRWWMGVAAAAAIVLAIMAGGQFMGGGANYEKFAQHDPLSLTERGDGVATGSQAEAAYNEGRYGEAISLLENYLREQSDDERARLALGVSLLEEDRDSEAVKVFEDIVETDSALSPYGNWYLALAAVKRGDNEAASAYLDLIPATDTYLTERAERLRAAL